MSDLAVLEQQALAELQACSDEAGLRAWHTRYFGKQGAVPQALGEIGKIPPAEQQGLRPEGQPGQGKADAGV